MKHQRYIVPEPKTYHGLGVLRDATDNKVAGLIGKSVSLASKIRYGLRTVSQTDAQLIAYLLGVDLEFLFEPYERKKRTK